jgi:ABC-type nitrate/sulfonate/bicarbonate transport system substrate-binding protein
MSASHPGFGGRRAITRRPFAAFGIGLALTALAALTLACGGDGDGGEEPSSGAPQTVRLQLDWTPNTNHIGIYVALSNGWYEEAGIDLEILPYGDTNPDAVVANGQADVAISFPANVIFSRAAGLELTSIAAVLQRNPTELTVLASSDIQSPKDFDGKTYAGFGLPYEEPQIRAVVIADGGTGDFEVATLETAAYEALYNGRADFTEMFMTWEGVEAELRGIEIRSFNYSDYGVPDFPGVVIVARTADVETGSPRLEKFLEVTRRGYEFAAENPAEASQVFLDHLPDAFPEPDLVKRSTDRLASYFVVEGRRWGVQHADDWNAYTQWFIDQDIVVDDNDNVIESMDDLPGGPLFSNELLPDG